GRRGMITAAEVLFALEQRVYQTVRSVHSERIALAAAKAVVKCLMFHFRQRHLYIPVTQNADLRKRNEAIWAAFNGRNHGELALQYRLTLQQIYAIVKTMRRVSASKYQTQLFDDPGAVGDERPFLLVVLEDYMPADLQRAGLTADAAKTLSGDIAQYLIDHYPGIQIFIHDDVLKRGGGESADLFDEAS
ncbi:hypothetical protein NP603_13940, partial [Methylomonas sp. SURF-1]